MEQLATLLLNSVLIIGIWWLYFMEYRPYRIQKTRQDLFMIRDQLFVYWAEHRHPFQNEAYQMVRYSLNGMINLCSKFTILHLVASLVADRQIQHAGAQAYESRFVGALEGLPIGAKKRLIKSRQEMHKVVLEHVIHSSVLMTVVYYLLLALNKTRNLQKKLTLDRHGKGRMSALDAEAANLGSKGTLMHA